MASAKWKCLFQEKNEQSRASKKKRKVAAIIYSDALTLDSTGTCVASPITINVVGNQVMSSSSSHKLGKISYQRINLGKTHDGSINYLPRQ